MKINKNVSISENGFVFNPTTGESFTVNPIGVEIINMIKMHSPEEEIKKFILEKYATDSSGFDKDFYDFIQMLKSYNLFDEENEENEN
ncbi:MAG: PqqD family protein [Bacteroidales bacterium]|nr:PqqD family protein [Bacteroidales bacterium]